MSELYETIELLCKSKGVNITQMCKESGVNRSSITDLKKGRSSELSTKTTSRLAEYFGVSIDYLLGKSSENLFINENGERKGEVAFLGNLAEILEDNAESSVNQRQLDNNKLAFALFGTSDVDDEVLEDVRKYAQIARRMREENKKEG